MNISLEGFEQIPYKEDDDVGRQTKKIAIKKILLDIAVIIKIFFAFILFSFIYMKLKHELAGPAVKIFLNYSNGSSINSLKIYRGHSNNSNEGAEMLFDLFIDLRQPANQTTIIQSIEIHTESEGETTKMTNSLNSFLFNETSTNLLVAGRLKLSSTKNRQCFDVDEPDGFVHFTTQIFINVGKGKARRVGFSNKQIFDSCCVRFCTPF